MIGAFAGLGFQVAEDMLYAAQSAAYTFGSDQLFCERASAGVKSLSSRRPARSGASGCVQVAAGQNRKARRESR
ncbi:MULTISPECIES: hypothetical protein [unclassified Rhodococcus (in: high G+C Gram-positive bacteria)]|uniref:hypothetical protein n=1 Tax=unclassified Rhodococcus (in: high G+C Gram-positive bacteria) TaxID=192944 RepID=UPI001E49C408|nr:MULTISPECIES: hypothetical protein [unclassified Rhodococcus (in: high G+C Gram-positive bacteria)]